MPSVVSIFCGCGGLDLGFKEAGFDLAYACDSDPAAVDCYARNVDRNVHLRDATSEEFHADIASLAECDVVLGGFPCQGFSKAGPKREEDERNDLYMEMLRAVGTLRPRMFVAENVDGLSQNFQGAFLTRIVADFSELDYDVDYHILDAANFGVPQYRRRIFFVGTRRGSDRAFDWPAPTHRAAARNGEFKVDAPLFERGLFGPQERKLGVNAKPRTIKDVISDLILLRRDVPDHEVTSAWPRKYEAVFKAVAEGQKLCNVRHAATSVYTWQIPEVFGQVTPREVVVLETISRHRRHKRYGNVPNGNPLPVGEIERLSGTSPIDEEIASLLAKGYLKVVGRGYDLKGAMFCSGLFKRPKWTEPAPTVLTNFHNPRYFLHPIEDRPFSLRECARLQTFPDTFHISSPGSRVSLIDGYRLIGNAVPPLVSAQFARAALHFLTRRRKPQATRT